jgi:hypothetical protein
MVASVFTATVCIGAGILVDRVTRQWATSPGKVNDLFSFIVIYGAVVTHDCDPDFRLCQTVMLL